MERARRDRRVREASERAATGETARRAAGYWLVLAAGLPSPPSHRGRTGPTATGRRPRETPRRRARARARLTGPRRPRQQRRAETASPPAPVVSRRALRKRREPTTHRTWGTSSSSARASALSLSRASPPASSSRWEVGELAPPSRPATAAVAAAEAAAVARPEPSPSSIATRHGQRSLVCDDGDDGDTARDAPFGADPRDRRRVETDARDDRPWQAFTRRMNRRRVNPLVNSRGE